VEEVGLAPGDVLDGRYVVEAELGRGGYGTVWRVRHQRLDALRAVKVLHDPGPELSAHLKAEGQVLARLEHPNIVRVHDLVELGDSLALVMELVEGPSLAAYLQRGPPELEAVVHIGRGILEGLAAAHRRGVLHRDLKPANIQLASGDGRPIPKLVDFGLAVEAAGDGRQAAAGTPAYMAPEQLEGRCDERSDLFSAATVLYELATGHRAFAAAGMAQLMMAKAQGRFDPPRSLRPDLPAGMARVLAEGLAPTPGSRPADAETMTRGWRLPPDGRSLVPAAPEAVPGDLASLGDSRATDRALGRRLPTPVAAAWHRVVRAADDRARREAVEASVHATLRFVLALLLADYLAGPADERVEAWLRAARRYQGARWLDGLAELGEALADRDDRFVADAPALARGQPLHRALGDVLAVTQGAVEQRVGEVRAVLVSLLFLDRTRLFRPLVGRGGGTGKVQFLVGADGLGEPAASAWTADLADRRVYALSPSGAEVLELSPLLAVGDDALGDAVGVFAGADEGRIALADVAGGVRWVRPVGAAGVPLDFEAWLADRSAGRRRQANRDDLGALSAPGSSSASGVVVGGRFELRDVLGVGGMSTVHRAWDRLADEEVALKLLAVDFAADPEFRERFKREAQRMRQLDHPHVLSAVELGSLDSGQLWLRMPVLDGGTLRDRIAAGDLDAERATRWTTELLSALVALDDAGVVHRDIKPSNLLLDGDDHLVLVDFGVALSEDDARLTRTLQQLGSLAYLAPECRGAGQATHRSDVYSAGLVIHELVTGRSAGALPGKGIDGVLGSQLRRMGAVDPDERPTAAEVLAVLDGPEPPAAPAPGAEEVGDDDRRVLALGVPLGAASGLLLSTPAWTVLPLQMAPGYAPGGALGVVASSATAAWGLAGFGLLLPLLAGLGFGHARRHGAVAGAITGTVAFAVGGVQVALMIGSRPVFDALATGRLDMPQVLGDSVVRLAWTMLLGGLLAPVVGGVLGVVAAWARRVEQQPKAPDVPLRMAAGAGLLVLAAVGGVAPPNIDQLLASVRDAASSTVGLDLTLGTVSVLARVPAVVGMVVGLWLCASPWVPSFRGETVTRLAWAAVVLAAQLVLGPLIGWLPAAVSGCVLLGVLAWRRPWDRPNHPSPPRDLIGLASMPLAAVAVASAALPLVQLGWAATSTLVWNLDALRGWTDPVPLERLATAELRHHFAATRLLLAGSALAAVVLWVVAVSFDLVATWASRGRRPQRHELLALAVALGGIGLMTFGTNQDLFDVTSSDPRPPARPTGPHEVHSDLWARWVRGDHLHALPPSVAEGDPEAHRWIAAAAAHVQGRPRPELGELSEPGRALVAALDGDPEALHAWLDTHDDPVLRSLHHAVGAVPWGDDEHEQLATPFPADQLLWMRRMELRGDAAGAEAFRDRWDERHRGGGLLELERAWAEAQVRRDPEAEGQALQRAVAAAPNRLDARVQLLQWAIRHVDAGREARLRDELLPVASASAPALPAGHVEDLVYAYLAAQRPRDAADLLREQLRRAEAEDATQRAAHLVAAARDVDGLLGPEGEALAARADRSPVEPLRRLPAPCEALFRIRPVRLLEVAAAGGCPATARTDALVKAARPLAPRGRER